MSTYRHTQYKHFRLGEFEFTNGLLSVQPAKIQAFLDLVHALPEFEQNYILEINESALRDLERSVTQAQLGGTKAAEIQRAASATALANAEANQRTVNVDLSDSASGFKFPSK